jgi:acetoin utilization protein AcuB
LAWLLLFSTGRSGWRRQRKMPLACHTKEKMRMLIKNWMSREVISVDASDAMKDANQLLREHKIRMLPVMDLGKLVGVVTDRDLKRASASDATALDVYELLYLLSKIRVREIMTQNPVTVPPDYTVEETAEILLKHKISGVPVVDSDAVVGVITQSDVFRAMIRLTGLAMRGIQFAFQIPEEPGRIEALSAIIRRYGGRLVSLLSYSEGAPAGFHNVYIRAYHVDRRRFDRLRAELKQEAALLYIVDHRENRREVF